MTADYDHWKHRVKFAQNVQQLESSCLGQRQVNNQAGFAARVVGG
jgi:hypothetical protein